YRDGEFLYQDFLYDDHGARFSRDPSDPRTSGDTFSQPNGTYTYPTNPAYAGNAADIVELRAKPLADATAFRLTLNTMNDPELTAATIAIGDSAVALPVPYGANATSPAQYFLTWHGNTADLRDAATGQPVSPAPTVSVDTARRQVELRIPHAAWDPGTSTVKLAAATGLWDKAANAYLIPGGSATADKPGGAGTNPAATAFFNVAFRTSEPVPDVSQSTEFATAPAWWRDRQQGTELATGNLGAFRQDVDFGKLAAGTNDDGGVPQTGPLDRILVSHFETKQGTDYGTTCGTSVECKGELRGRLQPYAIYVPDKKGANGYGMTLLLHSLGANYNQFTNTRNQSQFGERGPGSIIITPSGRGPDGWYYDYAGADTFEVWADVAARYPLDPAYTSIAGYSMGGYGTYKFATQYPDLFAKAQPTVGPPGLGVAAADPSQPSPGGPQSSTFRQLASLRNIPFLIWNAVEDELVPYAGATRHANGFDDLDYRYEWDSFANAEHLTLAAYDQFAPAAAFLGADSVDRNPAHVTYVRNPTMDFPDVGTRADHAYWLSGIHLADGSGTAPLGTIDVRSEGFGTGDPAAGGTTHGAGALTGGNHLPAVSFTSQSKSWGPVPSTPKRDRLDIEAHNVAGVTIDPARAKVTCAAEIAVTSDSPLVVKLEGCKDGRAVFGQSARCGAKGTPRSSIARGGLRASRKHGIRATGRAIGFRCVSGKRARGIVRRVEVAVARHAGSGKCQYLTSKGKLGTKRSCTNNAWVRAKLGRQRGGKVPWTFRTTRGLPRGTYELRVRAVDSTGTVERQPRKQARKTIRVR
ncbi:MAG: hypothetical protein QOJ07_2569, partial [Thermoleophilaceae bacterium]|nr:hypothetical protein [Thermoleophilaceae bacterium]